MATFIVCTFAIAFLSLIGFVVYKVFKKTANAVNKKFVTWLNK